MSREWVKLYTSMLLHADTQSLDGDAFKAWVNIILLAGTIDDGGRVGAPRDVAFAVRVSTADLDRVVKALDGRLVDRDGQLHVRDWNDWQAKSDRERKRDERARKQRDLPPAAANKPADGVGVTPSTDEARAVTGRPDTSRDVTNGHVGSRLRGEEIRKEKNPPYPPPGDASANGTASSQRSRATGGDALSNGHATPDRQWAPLCAAVSEAMGGIRVVDAKRGEPLAWVGQICAIAGRYASGDVQAACNLWELYRLSPKWQYKPSRPVDLPAHFGAWCADNPGIARRAVASNGALLTEDAIRERWPGLTVIREGRIMAKSIHVLATEGVVERDSYDFVDRSTWPADVRECHEAVAALRGQGVHA